MRRTIALAGVVVLLLAGAIGVPGRARAAGPSPMRTAPLHLRVWFAMGDRLFVTSRTLPATPAVATAAMRFLLAGPSAAEKDAGVITAIPTGTALNGVTVSGGTATVDLSEAYASGGGSLAMFMRLAQVVYTLTQFPTVHGVSFELDGVPVTVFSSEGIELDGPQTRADYRDLLPAILVKSPSIGDRVTGSARVVGSAWVFEGGVAVRVLDASGAVVGRGFTTAAYGMDRRGPFALRVRFTIDRPQRGTVVVQDDGADPPPHVIRIPVRLLP